MKAAPQYLFLSLLAVASLLAAAENSSKGTSSGSRTPEKDPQVDITPRVKPAPKTPEQQQAAREPSIRVETQLVLINVTVTDPLNRFVTGLEKEHFTLFEDKVKQEITQFSSEDAPLSIGLVFDASGRRVLPDSVQRPP